MAFTDDPAEARKTFGFGLCASLKFRFDTRGAADRSARYVLRRQHKRVRVYRCLECHGWHLTSSLGGGR